MAAILLHSEARQFLQGAAGAVQGTLREPLLKLMHFMRAMEYKDKDDEMVVFKELQEVMGQFPFQSPTVFNFFQFDFELKEPEPEPESESEKKGNMGGGCMMGMGTCEKPRLVSPEFQIFTPPYFVGFLNGMTSLIKNGVSHNCDSAGLGVNVRFRNSRWTRGCPGGDFGYSFRRLKANAATVSAELDTLLTGGRMSGLARTKVAEAFASQVGDINKLKAAMQVAVLTPEFHTQGGASRPLKGLRNGSSSGGASSAKPYKAVVLLFLAGGADTWNMVVPNMNSAKGSLWSQYQAMRSGLALNVGEMRALNGQGFSIHFRLDWLAAELFNKQAAAAIFTNIGNLAEPLLGQDDWRGRTGKKRCAGIFSHADQQTGAQTLKCQVVGHSPLGIGGRLADGLRDQYSVATFSLAGSSIWPQGKLTNREILSSSGTKRFEEYPELRKTISEFTNQTHGNAYAEEFAKAFKESIISTEKLGQAVDGVTLLTNWGRSRGLKKQLELVSKLIKVHGERGSERDFFFVQTGGWDMHANMNRNLAIKLNEMDEAFKSFHDEMKAQNLWEQVVFMTHSEFGRTLDDNGGGSDHGYAGQHLMFGGAINGGKIYNSYPRNLKAYPENPLEIGRGRLIPEYPWESMLVPLAKWLGLESSAQLKAAFPNIDSFNSTTLNTEANVFKATSGTKL